MNMTKEEAFKKVRATKVPDENYMLLTMSYDKKLVMPWKHGLQMLAALEHAAMLDEDYSKAPRISPIATEEMRFSMISRSNYELIKVSELLQLSRDDHQAMVRQFENTHPPKPEEVTA